MNDCKISIIVPIYNVEQYLRKCLDSLVNQTMKDIEIILVNDASPDSSDLIMEEYKSRYPDIIKCIYHEENMDLGGARNTGIRHSKGEYVMFVDSDDYVDTTICEKLYNKACENDSDIVSCEYKEGQEGRFREVDQYSTQVMGELNYEKRRLLMSVHSVGAVAKIIKKRFLFDNNIFFPEHRKFEDLATVPLWWVYAKRFDEVQEPLYYYIRHDSSITMTINSSGYYELFKSAKLIYQQFIDRNLSNTYRECMDNILIRAFIDEVKFLNQYVDIPDENEIQILKDDVDKLIYKYADNPMLYMRNEPKAIAGAKLLMKSPSEFCCMLRNRETKKLDGNYFFYYQMKKDRVQRLFRYCNEKGYRMVLWGAGAKGKDFLVINDPDAVNIEYVVDRDKKKWNQQLDSKHIIMGFEEIWKQIDVVIGVNKVYFGGIYREVKAKNKDIKVVNLDLLLMSNEIKEIEEFME